MVIVFYISLLIISVISATILAILIHKPIEKVFTSLAPQNISRVWTRIVIIAIYVLSLYGGIDINRMIGIKEEDLSIDRWTIEIINAVIHSLMDPLSMIVFLFMICLVAIGILRVLDKYIKKKTNNENAPQKRLNERAK